MLDFSQAFLELKKNKYIKRPTFGSGVYLFMLPEFDNIFVASTENNQLLHYAFSIKDYEAIDWETLPI